MTKQIPSNWMDVGDGIYHFEDMAIYSSDKSNEVHLLNVTKSKFSFLLLAAVKAFINLPIFSAILFLFDSCYTHCLLTYINMKKIYKPKLI